MTDAPTPQLLPCKYCGGAPFLDWDNEDYKIECENASRCKAWPRFYTTIRPQAIDAWNAAMTVSPDPLRELRGWLDEYADYIDNGQTAHDMMNALRQWLAEREGGGGNG